MGATRKFQYCWTRMMEKRYKKNCCPTTRLKSRTNPRNLHILRKIPTLPTTGKNCLMMPLQNNHFMEFKHFYIFAEFYIYLQIEHSIFSSPNFCPALLDVCRIMIAESKQCITIVYIVKVYSCRSWKKTCIFL